MNQALYPVIILAGGLATRLRPITDKVPKSLIKINNEPFIFHQLRRLKNQGIREVVISIGFLGEMICDCVDDGSSFGLSVQYVSDGDTLLGTAGAIRNCLPQVGESFFVMYGDSYLTCDFTAVQHSFIHSKKIGLMTVFKNQGRWDRSNTIFNKNEIIQYDKKNPIPEMHYIDYGLGLLTKAAFTLPGVDRLTDLSELYQILLQHRQLAGFEIHERFYEIGSLSGIKEMNEFFSA